VFILLENAYVRWVGEFTDGEFDRARRVKSHSVGVSTT